VTTVKHIAVLTTGRQDWGILRSTCALLRSDARFALSLWSGGMHESAKFGRTGDDIVREGFVIERRMAWLDDTSETAAHVQASRALEHVGNALRTPPDALLLAGDRIETASAAMAATLARVPIIHLHGGEETEGAFDNALRHAITKMSHLHLVSCEAHARRVTQMGEPSSSVHVVGAPGLDNLHRNDIATRADLEQSLGIALESPLVVVTLHPSTLGADAQLEAEAVAGALDDVDATYVITLPNADPGNAATRAVLSAAVERNPKKRIAVESMGERRYWGIMRAADAMLGNSSSALVEAPAVHLPAVNVGDRQRGRVRGENVIDAPPDRKLVATALRHALSPEGRARAKGPSPFGDGKSAPRIVEVLAQWTQPQPPVKRWSDA
jgi:UDP-hydrolysing UDP-N-acetyl-D-glucosamine 2-epimerase